MLVSQARGKVVLLFHGKSRRGGERDKGCSRSLFLFVVLKMNVAYDGKVIIHRACLTLLVGVFESKAIDLEQGPYVNFFF